MWNNYYFINILFDLCQKNYQCVITNEEKITYHCE